MASYELTSFRCFLICLTIHFRGMPVVYKPNKMNKPLVDPKLYTDLVYVFYACLLTAQVLSVVAKHKPLQRYQ